MGYGWARWLRRFQSDPHTADKSGSSPGENSHNRGWETGLSAVALKTLLRLEWEAEPDFGSPSRLS